MIAKKTGAWQGREKSSQRDRCFFQLITLSPDDGTDPVIAPMLLQCYDPLLVKVPQIPASETYTSEL